MKILYFGNLCDDLLFNEILFVSKSTGLKAQQLFEKGLCNGLESQGISVSHISFLHNKSFSKKQLGAILKKYGTKKFTYINNNVNSVCKAFEVFLKSLWIVVKWGRGEEKIILSCNNYMPLNISIWIGKKITRIKSVVYINDNYCVDKNVGKYSFKSTVKSLMAKTYRCFDAYIFVTNKMNLSLNVNNKMFLVVDGILNDSDLKQTPLSVEKENAICYVGSIQELYGVKNLIKSFMRIDDSSLQLWLFGDNLIGEYLNESCIKDNRIRYFGFLERSTVFEYICKAKFVVNFRNPDDEYTKLSFPSKTFEFLYSKTPMISTRLECYTEEYENIIFWIKDNTIETIEDSLKQLLKLQDDKLAQVGEKAKTFVIDTRNQDAVAIKVINFLQKVVVDK
ncbi:MAG: glycosyltransferase [Erysipelotrichales bacterium]|nr:glycosyltransferase [Erysipelotrichales bacterium]